MLRADRAARVAHLHEASSKSVGQEGRPTSVGRAGFPQPYLLAGSGFLHHLQKRKVSMVTTSELASCGAEDEQCSNLSQDHLSHTVTKCAHSHLELRPLSFIGRLGCGRNRNKPVIMVSDS
jgi:hypothetical protein